MWARIAKAHVKPRRQRTQYTCMSTSMAMALTAVGKDTTEDEVNKVMGARPMRGASWEQAIACAQHYGCRATLICPSTVKQLKEYTDRGVPVMIAWNPEGRDWSHASVVFDVDDNFNVHVADPNIPDPDEVVRILPKKDFYDRWYEKWPNYLVRRPALAIEEEISPGGRQMFASMEASMNPDIKRLKKAISDEALEAVEQRLQKMGAKMHMAPPSDDFVLAVQDNLAAARMRRQAEYSGLYGFRKAVQKTCESAIGKLARQAKKMARDLYIKDERTAEFLKTHADRTGSQSALVLRQAMESFGPKAASVDKEAGRRRMGLYGYPEKVASMCLDACSSLRNEAGKIANNMHRRKADRHANITGFLERHSKEAGCGYSSLLYRVYPAEGAKLASAPPETVDGWLNW